MIYGFDTDDEHAATGALLVYATWRSRDQARFRVTPDVWSQVERFVKASAKRAVTIPQFLELLKPRLSCGTLAPWAMQVGLRGPTPLLSMGSGQVLEVATPEDQREFMAGVMERADHRAVIDRLYRETAWIVLLVRDRLERERPIEARAQRIAAALEEE
jgi:hypothetical protein